ncbi:hypothetical protein D9619_008881 [Psilocybe cf. subviscida]|uniref:Uncharacterized protein n=1 Tax=Psilocybe cf. subviscida TaxID=2480587 RepID=A0A8H5F114_9AGAR|nr:hypothetical protein D9619_008881 [Psilocybe cf. subviscida]
MPGPYENVKTTTLLGYWPFVGTYYDVSPNSRGPALYKGTNVSLGFENNVGFVQIRKPGFLNVPAVDLRTISFAIEFTLRVASVPQARQILLSNWQSTQWQYLMTLDTAGKMSLTLRRNMDTNGSDPTQDLVSVTTAATVPVGKFFNVAYVYDSTRRKLSVFINGVLSASSVVRQEVTDLTLHTSTQEYVQLGNKGDDSPTTGNLDADLSQLRFYQLTF